MCLRVLGRSGEGSCGSCFLAEGCRLHCLFQGEQLLIGRRFMDQLRAPNKRGSGRVASVMAGPRGKDGDTAGEEEEASEIDESLNHTRLGTVGCD